MFVVSLSPNMGVYLTVFIVVLRNAVIGAQHSIGRSLIMDLVPKEHRGKWSSIQSLSRMTWSGSAFVGGALSDSHDYRYAFFLTACVHSVCFSILFVTAVLARLKRLVIAQQ